MNNDEIKVKLSYGVDYYKGDKGDKPVKGVDYFTEQDINEIIETIQAGEYDLTSYATKDYVDNAIAGMIVEETDPTVPEWAKQATKPSYNANEVGALPVDTQLFSGNYNDLSNKPTIPTVPSNVSAFTNDAGYLTSHQDLTGYATESYVDTAIENIDIPDAGITVETDPTVPQWAKQANKPSYTAQEVGALPANTQLFSGSYNDLTNKPTLFSGDYDDLSNKPTLFSGNYNDLTNKPTIPVVPSNVSAFNNDAGYVNSSAVNTAISNATINADQVIIGEEEDEETGEMVNVYLSNNHYATTDDIDYLSNYVDGELAKIDPSLSNADVEAGRVLISEEYDDETGETIQTFLPDKLTEIENAIADIPAGGITVETDPTVPSWAKQANKPTYTAQEVGALPANTALFSGDYEDLTNKPTLTPAPIIIQVGIAGQPSVVDGVYTLPLAITSNNMAEAYAQYQTHPSTVGMAVDLTALGRATKMYLDCESFYRYEVNDGYTYETFGEFNDNSLSQSFGYEFMNVNIHLYTGEAGSEGTLTGLSTINQLASKANSADLATVATSGDYNDLTNKPTIPTAYTLPTATTSTLGGVKVDGTTITITDGVISSSASGGSSYTAGQGISIDNGEISFDGVFDDTISINYITYYANDNIENETGLAIDGLTVHSYGEPDIETGDQEDTGIDITSSGITFTSPEGGTHTLGSALNGELSIDGDKILTTADNISGGSNNSSFPMYVSGLIPSSRNLTKQEIIDKLLAGEVVYDPPRGTQITSQELANHSRVKKIGPYNVSTGTVNNSNSSSFTLNNDYYYYYVAGQKTSYQSYETAGVLFESSTGAFGLEMPYADNQLSQEKTPYYLQLQINHLNTAISSKQDAIIPSAPTTDGNYVLQATVADGAVVYDWVEVSVGGSY